MRAFMAHKLLILLLFIRCGSFSSYTAAGGGSVPVEELCKKASGYVDYAFCERVLKSDPNNNNSDLSGLATFSLKLSAANATSTESKLASMAVEEPNPSVRNALQACLHMYSNAIPTLESSMEFLAAKDLVAAEAMISASVFAPTYCKTALKERLLNAENDDFSNLLLLDTAITNFMS